MFKTKTEQEQREQEHDKSEEVAIAEEKQKIPRLMSLETQPEGSLRSNRVASVTATGSEIVRVYALTNGFCLLLWRAGTGSLDSFPEQPLNLCIVKTSTTPSSQRKYQQIVTVASLLFFITCNRPIDSSAPPTNPALIETMNDSHCKPNLERLNTIHEHAQVDDKEGNRP